MHKLMKKDYYKILEVTPAASPADIKRSYRKLAVKYHPDKNNGNKLSEARFKEIQEAYRILADEAKRAEYNRSNAYYNYTSHVKDDKKQQAPATAQSLLHQSQNLRRQITMLDPYRMNKLAVFQQIQHLLSHHHLQVLQSHNDHRINKKIIEETLICCRYLPYAHVEKICFQLATIAGADNQLYQRIYQFSRQARLQTYWNKYKMLAAIIAAIVLCYAIYKLSIGSAL